MGAPTPPGPPRPRAANDTELDVPVTVGDTEPSPAPAPSSSAPPVNPTLREIYALIDQRLSPEIITRISSIPPPKAEPKAEEAPRSSIRAAARKSYVVTKVTMALLGLSVVLLEAAAERLAERYPHLQGPLEALFEVALRLLKGAS